MDFENLKPVKLEIKVLGTGCSKCKSLEKETLKVVEELAIDAVVEKVEDIQEIMAFGIMATPGLVINGDVVHSGSLLKSSEIKDLVNKYL